MTLVVKFGVSWGGYLRKVIFVKVIKSGGD